MTNLKPALESKAAAAEPLFNVVGGGEDGGIFPCSPERRDDCLRKIGGSEGLLMAKLLFTEADLLYLLRVCPTEADLLDLLPTEADLLRV